MYLNLSSIFSFLFVLSMASSAQSQAIGDYDGDGTSDISVAITYSNGTSAYLTRLTNGATPKFWSWNRRADAFAAGMFWGNRITYPAIVELEDQGLPLRWTFKTPSNTDHTLYYGLPGDRIANHGPDFDGDGISEVYVVRPDQADGQLSWYIASSRYKQIYRISWGLRNDLVFAADTNGNGKAEMIALRPSTFEWFAREFDSNSHTNVQWGLPGDIPILPYDLNRDGRAEYIISRVEGGAQFAYIKFSNGGFEKRALGQATSLPMVGQFGPNRGFAWNQRDTGWFANHKADLSLNLFRFGIPENIVVRPDGTAIGPNDSGKVSAQSAYSPEQNRNSPVQGACTSPKFPDGRNGYLWKPHREGGWTRGDATFLVPLNRDGALSSSVEIYGKNGELVHKPKLRYHFGHGVRSAWDMDVKNSVLNRSAPLRVRTIYEDGSCHDISVPNASRRYD